MEPTPENNEIFTEKEWEIILTELSLSPRQKEIVRYLFSSLSDKQIAAKLNISVPTVRTHIGRLFSKFHLQDRNELILRVFRQFRQGCRLDNCECQNWHHKIDALPNNLSEPKKQKSPCLAGYRRKHQ